MMCSSLARSKRSYEKTFPLHKGIKQMVVSHHGVKECLWFVSLRFCREEERKLLNGEL
ncbi:MAG: hypothetical protein AOA65_1616 [Candidatus Bathyarchaeota archaeon BA1]|nr:MAG: hypothetical protein AOA65_1616 [Candidatus Bathyarchaeota archaeon BA1]